MNIGESMPLPADIPSLHHILEGIAPLRSIVARINPDTTAIVTLVPCLNEAIAHYSGMKVFLLADVNDEKEAASLGRAYGVDILPLSQRRAIAQKKYCLYATPLLNIWSSGGLEPLASLCAARGLIDNYMVAAATMEPLPKRKPSPDHIERRMEDVLKIYNTLADEQSREVFLRCIKSLATGNAGYLPCSPYPQYKHPRVAAQSGDVVVDGGAFDGASAVNFSKSVGAQGKVIAFEPLPQSNVAAMEHVDSLGNVLVEPYALWSHGGDFFISSQSSASTLSANANDGIPCKAISLDEYFRENPGRCDCIKLDVEGAELEVLAGAEGTINKWRPKLQVCLYHKQSHYLDIPLKVMRKWPFYKLYLGHHSHGPWETCLYAIADNSD